MLRLYLGLQQLRSAQCQSLKLPAFPTSSATPSLYCRPQKQRTNPSDSVTQATTIASHNLDVDALLITSRRSLAPCRLIWRLLRSPLVSSSQLSNRRQSVCPVA